ncbi:RraA family protein [Desertibaculum subflavum]|uniref:RraA family protein n=1 Tax=Desertibaculum subflavum TaxID=2268458 RepID=UPI000E6722E1
MAADAALLEQAKRVLYTAVLSDVLDGLGHRHQAMRPSVRPLDDTLMLFGRARTGIYMDVYHVDPAVNPYELEIRLIDDLKPGEVAVLACGTSGRIAPWGELLTTASRARGAAGCVTDGLCRDLRLIREMRFPVFCGGIGPLDSKGRGMVMAIDVPVETGGVHVAPGDLVVGDVDGVIVVPKAVEVEALRLAIEKVAAEDTTRKELEAGALLADVFKRHGVL